MVRELECLVDWLMSGGNLFLNDATILRQLHALLEAGVTGHSSVLIRDATEAALKKLVNHVSNFPPRPGISVLTSQLCETDDVLLPIPDAADYLYFLYNRSSLVSLVPLASEGSGTLKQSDGKDDSMAKEHVADGGMMARMIIRDATGKYAWNAAPAYAYRDSNTLHGKDDESGSGSGPHISVPRCSRPTTNVLSRAPDSHHEEPAPSSPCPSGPPMFSSDQPSKNVDKLRQLLT